MCSPERHALSTPRAYPCHGAWNTLCPPDRAAPEASAALSRHPFMICAACGARGGRRLAPMSRRSLAHAWDARHSGSRGAAGAPGSWWRR